MRNGDGQDRSTEYDECTQDERWQFITNLFIVIDPLLNASKITDLYRRKPLAQVLNIFSEGLICIAQYLHRLDSISDQFPDQRIIESGTHRDGFHESRGVAQIIDILRAD